jgi:hypothetical protein
MTHAYVVVITESIAMQVINGNGMAFGKYRGKGPT